MATIIDSLIIQLGLDAKDVDAKAPGVRRKLSDLEKGSLAAEKGLKGLTGALESFAGVLGSLVGAAVVTSFAKDIIETNTHLYYLSQNLGISAQKLYAWGQMAKQLGGSSADIQNFFGQVRGMYGQLLTGQTPPLLRLFTMLGLQYSGQKPQQVLEQLAKRFQGFDKGPNRWKAASFLEASGLSEGVVNMILQGPAWIRSHAKELTALSPTDRQIAASAKMTEKIVTVQTAVNKVGNDLLTKIMPVLNRAAYYLERILGWLIGHGNITSGLAAGGLGLASLAGVGGLLGILGMGAASMAGVVSALGAIGIALYVVASHWKQVSSAAHAAWEWTGKFIHQFDQVSGSLWDKIAHTMGWNTSESFQSQQENSAISAYNKAHPNAQIVEPSDQVRYLGTMIAQREGFYASGDSIPKRAHNPGDIIYGSFAKKYGATGYVTAQGGKKVAVFPNDRAGFNAMWALLGSKGYSGLSDADAISRWQTGHVASLAGSHVAALMSGLHSSSHTTTTDNSKSVHIGTMQVNHPSPSVSSAGSFIGMDWLFAPQFNGGLF